MNAFLVSGFAIAACAASASAATVHVRATGLVTFNDFQAGSLVNVQPGEAAWLTFDVDSNSYVDSPNFPARGYAIDQSTFVLTIGAATVHLANPFPAGQTPYFVIRNNDPGVDGFVISTNVDVPEGLAIDQPGVTMSFLRTFDSGAIWNSLNILQALGTYGVKHLSSYEWSLDIGRGAAMEIAYRSISLWTDPPACTADVTGDGQVNMDDLVEVLKSWGPCASPCSPGGGGAGGRGGAGGGDNAGDGGTSDASPCIGDVTHDCQVNIDDFISVITHWGPCG